MGSYTKSIERRHIDTGNLLRTYDWHAHNYAFNCLAFSPDGTKAFSSLWWKNSAFHWDTTSGQVLFHVELPGPVHSVDYSPSGNTLVAGGDALARMWDAQSGELMRTFEGHSARVNGVAISPDGSRILTGSSDHTAILWDATTGEQIRTFDGYPAPVWSVAFSSDARPVLIGASGGHNNEARFPGITQIRDVETGDVIQSFEGGFWCCFSPDGTQVLSGGGDGEIVGQWSASTGELIREFRGGPFSYAPDGKTILFGEGYGSSAGGHARLHDTATGHLLRSFEGPGGRGDHAIAAFHPAGKYVLTCSDDVVAAVWDIRDILARPTASLRASGPEVSWDYGLLQFAPRPDGPWSDLPAASPMRVSPLGRTGFFRVRATE